MKNTNTNTTKNTNTNTTKKAPLTVTAAEKAAAARDLKAAAADREKKDDYVCLWSALANKVDTLQKTPLALKDIGGTTPRATFKSYTEKTAAVLLTAYNVVTAHSTRAALRDCLIEYLKFFPAAAVVKAEPAAYVKQTNGFIIPTDTMIDRVIASAAAFKKVAGVTDRVKTWDYVGASTFRKSLEIITVDEIRQTVFPSADELKNMKTERRKAAKAAKEKARADRVEKIMKLMKCDENTGYNYLRAIESVEREKAAAAAADAAAAEKAAAKVTDEKRALYDEIQAAAKAAAEKKAAAARKAAETRKKKAAEKKAAAAA